MPVYEFVHPPTGEVISVFVKLDEPASARAQQAVSGKLYKRVYSAPQASKDTRQGDGTLHDYRRTTGEKNLTVAEGWEISKEASAKRAELYGGVDPVKEQYYKDYERKTGGKHLDVKNREMKERGKKLAEEWGIKVG